MVAAGLFNRGWLAAGAGGHFEQAPGGLQLLGWDEQVHVAHRAQEGLVDQLDQVQSFEGDDGDVLGCEVWQQARQLVVEQEVAGGVEEAGLLQAGRDFRRRVEVEAFQAALEQG